MEPQIYGQEQDSAPLVFTEAAARKVGQLLQEEDNSALMLRVYISGGGCSGFQYGFTFDDRREEGDASVEQLGVTLLVDPTSLQYLEGAEIDFKDDLSGARFV
ncbi:MAG: iron-sulfur cluster insertion protein ErpA, partial [Gammaproteobacteria bacterium]|nr:iron-sulfur cluster insertion protein ErpA [Gammaproteobacteria bacterium]